MTPGVDLYFLFLCKSGVPEAGCVIMAYSFQIPGPSGNVHDCNLTGWWDILNLRLNYDAAEDAIAGIYSLYGVDSAIKRSSRLARIMHTSPYVY